jgi:hypothetical protein
MSTGVSHRGEKSGAEPELASENPAPPRGAPIDRAGLQECQYYSEAEPFNSSALK